MHENLGIQGHNTARDGLQEERDDSSSAWPWGDAGGASERRRRVGWPAPAQQPVGSHMQVALPPQANQFMSAGACWRLHALSNHLTMAKNGDYDYDLVTLGAGSGGVRASRLAASAYGARVRAGWWGPSLCPLKFVRGWFSQPICHKRRAWGPWHIRGSIRK